MSKIKLNKILFNDNSLHIDKQAFLARESSYVSNFGDENDLI